MRGLQRQQQGVQKRDVLQQQRLVACRAGEGVAHLVRVRVRVRGRVRGRVWIGRVR